MLHIIGTICLAIGIFILSPLDEILILAPLSVVMGPQIILIVLVIGWLLTITGVALLGTHALLAFGVAGAVIFAHPIFWLVIVLPILIVVLWGVMSYI